jgi:hypothetical protein
MKQDEPAAPTRPVAFSEAGRGAKIKKALGVGVTH